jgi:thiamine-phosphate pyrophosphorylase
MFFTDPVRTPSPEEVVGRLPRGSAVVFRAFGAPDSYARGQAVAKAARRRGVIFLVGADVALAVRLGADGVHLPQAMTGRAGAIRVMAQRFTVTGAAHDLPAALRANRCGVHAVVVSPLFPSDSPSAGRPMGVLAFAALARRIPAPVYALGGINAGNARRLAGSGAVGIAAIGALAGQNLKVVSSRTRGGGACG